MSWHNAALLIGGGLFAGVVNTLAGGGSVVSVPLLVLVGLPGTIANGSNRVGVFAQSLVAAWRFRAQGVSGFRKAAPLLLPIALGSTTGAYLISQVADETFERLFGILMILLLIPILRRTRSPDRAPRRPWPWWMTFLVFLAMGLYGGAFQAGVGIPLVLALAHSGYDLVKANSIKVVVNTALTLVAVPVFFFQQQIAWLPAGLLAIGFGCGGELGARLAVHGGDRVIKPVLTVAVVALAGRMIGLY